MGTLHGQALSHYRIVEQVGGGGMGVVYRAEDTRLGRSAALKFLPEDLAQDSQALERFKREARAASALNHPNICTVHAIEQHERRHFIVMELIEGETLARLIGRQPFGLGQILDMGIQIADALESAHARGIVHRDIKPANIFCDEGTVKVGDYGLSKYISCRSTLFPRLLTSRFSAPNAAASMAVPACTDSSSRLSAATNALSAPP